jgi:hypothetical protein
MSAALFLRKMKIKTIGQNCWNSGNNYPKSIQVPNWSLWSVLFVYAIKQIFHFWHIIPILLAQVTYHFVWSTECDIMADTLLAWLLGDTSSDRWRHDSYLSSAALRRGNPVYWDWFYPSCLTTLFTSRNCTVGGATVKRFVAETTGFAILLCAVGCQYTH